MLNYFILFIFYFSINSSLNLYSIKKMVKVTVAGAAGGIGQPLSLLLKLNQMLMNWRYLIL